MRARAHTHCDSGIRARDREPATTACGYLHPLEQHIIVQSSRKPSDGSIRAERIPARAAAITAALQVSARAIK